MNGLRLILAVLLLNLGLACPATFICSAEETTANAPTETIPAATPEKTDTPDAKTTDSDSKLPVSTLDPVRRVKNIGVALGHTWELTVDMSSRIFLWFWWGIFIGGFLGLALGITLWWAGLKYGFFEIPPRWWRWLRHIVPLGITTCLMLSFIYGGVFAGVGYRVNRAILDDRILDRITVSIASAVIMDANEYELKSQQVEDQMAKVAQDAPKIKKMAEGDFLDAKKKTMTQIPWYISWLISFTEADKWVDGQLSKQVSEADPRILIGLYVMDGDLKKYRESHPDAPPVLIALAVAMDNAQRKVAATVSGFCIGQVLIAALLSAIMVGLAVLFLWVLRIIFKGKPSVTPSSQPQLVVAVPAKLP